MAISFHRFIDKLGIKRLEKLIRFDKNFVGLMKLCRETPIFLPKNCVIHFIFQGFLQEHYITFIVMLGMIP